MWQRHRHDIHENRLQAAGRYSHVCRECWAVLKIAYYHTTRASIKHVYFVRVHFICINRKKKIQITYYICQNVQYTYKTAQMTGY